MSTPFETLATKLGGLVAERNKSYGNSFAKTGDFLRLLYPNGIQPEQMVDALLLSRIFDKQMRIANGHREDSYEDIAGYGILGAVNATAAGAQAPDLGQSACDCFACVTLPDDQRVSGY